MPSKIAVEVRVVTVQLTAERTTRVFSGGQIQPPNSKRVIESMCHMATRD